MHRHPLRFLLLIAVLLLLPSWTRSAQASGAALQFVPSDAMAVVGVDFDGFRKTPLYRLVVQAMRKDKSALAKIGELKKETGFDVFKDIHGLTVVLTDDMLKHNDDQFVVVVDAP